MEKNIDTTAEKLVTKNFFKEDFLKIFFEAVAVTPKGAKEICKELREICPGFPSLQTFWAWINEDIVLIERFHAAKQLQAIILVDEILAISNGEDKSESDRAKIKIDARKWLGSRLLPKIYGDKQDISHNVTVTHESLLLEADKLK